MSKRGVPLEAIVARKVTSRYLATITHYTSFESIRQGLDPKRFKVVFNGVVYQYDVSRKQRHRIRVVVRTHLKRKLSLLATNPGQAWLS